MNCKPCFLFILLFLISIFSFQNLFSQTNFYNDYLQQEAYYDSLIEIRGVDNMEGTGYTQYKRWFRYWAPKLLPDRDYNDYNSDLMDYLSSRSTPTGGGTFDANWKLIGPNEMPEELSSSGGGGTGQIHYIYKNPHFSSGNYMFACSPVGGLFYSTNYGDSWKNAGTDKGLLRSGVSSIVVDPKDQQTWYITTGNGESYLSKYIWQYAIGLYRSTNEGQSWEKLGLDNVKYMRKVIDARVSENTTLLVTTSNGLYRINNANTQNWEIEKEWDGEFYDIEVDLNNDSIFYASGSDTTGIISYDARDGSVSTLFSMDSMPTADNRRFSLECTSVNPNYLYAVYTSNGDTNKPQWIYRYDI